MQTKTPENYVLKKDYENILGFTAQNWIKLIHENISTGLCLRHGESQTIQCSNISRVFIAPSSRMFGLRERKWEKIKLWKSINIFGLNWASALFSYQKKKIWTKVCPSLFIDFCNFVCPLFLSFKPNNAP
jgi:hypothetical protein